jgi:hypothetical protein
MYNVLWPVLLSAGLTAYKWGGFKLKTPRRSSGIVRVVVGCVDENRGVRGDENDTGENETVDIGGDSSTLTNVIIIT